MKVMVVDDSTFMRRIIKNHLRALGHEIAGEARDGAEAVQLYSQLKPDLVFMDIVMPEMSGIQALRAIKEEHPEARVIICSSMGHSVYIQEAIMAGALDFVVKPFKTEKIRQVIKRFT